MRTSVTVVVSGGGVTVKKLETVKSRSMVVVIVSVIFLQGTCFVCVVVVVEGW